jgi:hypothetical protein
MQYQYQVSYWTDRGPVERSFFAASNEEARLRGFVLMEEDEGELGSVKPIGWFGGGSPWEVCPHHP